MKKPKVQADKILFDSPILDEPSGVLPGTAGLSVSGQLNIGKSGHLVTIFVEDEETGECLEVNHVKTALLVVEDSRSSSNGWLSVAIGSMSKLNQVLGFLAKVTLEGLERLARKQTESAQ